MYSHLDKSAHAILIFICMFLYIRINKIMVCGIQVTVSCKLKFSGIVL